MNPSRTKLPASSVALQSLNLQEGTGIAFVGAAVGVAVGVAVVGVAVGSGAVVVSRRRRFRAFFEVLRVVGVWAVVARMVQHNLLTRPHTHSEENHVTSRNKAPPSTSAVLRVTVAVMG